jgi:precorrin-2/cobalt-factor-2 C20-methyltransferase
MTYSTYGYVLQYVKKIAPDVPVISVPGITSYQACAASLNTPLVEGEESLLIVSGVNGGACLRKFAVVPENLVFMKAYRNVKDIAATLDEIGLLNNSVAIKNCGLPDQEIIRDIRILKTCPPNYWTLVMAQQKKSDDPQEEE